MLVSSLFLKDSIEDILTQDNFAGITFFICYGLELVFNEIVPAFLVFDRQYIRSFELSKVGKLKESFLKDSEIVKKEKFQKKEFGVSVFERKPEFLESIRGKKKESLRKGSIEEIEGMFGTIKNDSYIMKGSGVKNDMSSLESVNSLEKTYWRALGAGNLQLKDLILDRDVIFGTSSNNSLGKCFLGQFKGYKVSSK